MAKQIKGTETTHVDGGIVRRDSRTGRFISVQKNGKTSAASALTQAAIREASTKRSAALKRLANR